MDEAVRVLALVLLGTGGHVDAGEVADAWRALWPDVAPLTDFDTKPDDPSTFTASLNGQTVAVGLVPSRVPEPDLSGPAVTSWLWPDAEDQLASHAAHAIVWLSASGTREQAHIDCTRLIAAVVRASDALGVYIGSATMVIRADVFVEIAQRYDPQLADQLWIDFRCLRNEDGSTSLFTVGLKAFGTMDLEVDHSPRPCSEVRAFVMNIAGYLTAHGPVINDGDTIGESEDQRIHVRYGRSIVDRADQVMRLVGY